MEEKLFIASFVAHIRPEHLPATREAFISTPFVEVPAADEKGKLVVVIDAPSEPELLDTADKMRGMTGVLSLLPVYQHAE